MDERPMRVEFYDEEIDGERLTCARFIFTDQKPGPVVAIVWTDDALNVGMAVEYDDAPFPTEGYDEPRHVEMINVAEFVAAYQEFRTRRSAQTSPP